MLKFIHSKFECKFHKFICLLQCKVTFEGHYILWVIPRSVPTNSELGRGGRFKSRHFFIVSKYEGGINVSNVSSSCY